MTMQLADAAGNAAYAANVALQQQGQRHVDGIQFPSHHYPATRQDGHHGFGQILP
jgi:hypothetical protein